LKVSKNCFFECSRLPKIALRSANLFIFKRTFWRNGKYENHFKIKMIIKTMWRYKIRMFLVEEVKSKLPEICFFLLTDGQFIIIKNNIESKPELSFWKKKKKWFFCIKKITLKFLRKKIRKKILFYFWKEKIFFFSSEAWPKVVRSSKLCCQKIKNDQKKTEHGRN
jgi:hypothetical protein